MALADAGNLTLWPPATPRDSAELIGYPSGKTIQESVGMSDYEHGKMNIETQEKTFHGFVQAVKYGVIISICVLIFMALVNG